MVEHPWIRFVQKSNKVNHIHLCTKIQCIMSLPFLVSPPHRHYFSLSFWTSWTLIENFIAVHYCLIQHPNYESIQQICELLLQYSSVFMGGYVRMLLMWGAFISVKVHNSNFINQGLTVPHISVEFEFSLITFLYSYKNNNVRRHFT